MGEMADFINEDFWDNEDMEPRPEDWLSDTDEQLVKESSFSCPNFSICGHLLIGFQERKEL
jgi:hypothetical protein